jgi:DNA-binding NarL/FixJ family response regulator
MLEQASSNPISVMIVEDDAVTRKMLSLAVESAPQFALVAQFDSVKPALAWLETGVVDILLTDLGLPDGSGIEIIHECVRRRPECDIMVITMASDDDNVLACIEAGASGYVLKDAGKLDVVRALLELRAGGSPISPIIARKVLTRMRDGKRSSTVSVSGASAAISLTKREASILELIARGDSYGDTAKALMVSVGTVQTHVKSIYDKLSVHSRGEAVYEAHRRGLLQFEAPNKDKR